MLKTNKFEIALNKFNDALTIGYNRKAMEGKIKAINGIGKSHFKSKNYKSALSAFEEVLNIYSKNKTAYSCRIKTT